MSNQEQLSNILKNFSLIRNGAEINKFKLLREIISIYNVDGYDKNFQLLFFTLLENRKYFYGYNDIINSLTREIGLFPYIEESELDNFKDAVAINTFVSPQIREAKTIFHYPQAKVFYTIMSGKSVILSAPTSFGKSLIIDAVIGTGKFNSIVIVVPTIALIDETRKRLSTFSSRYKIITHKTQEKGNRNIYVLTQERVVIDDFIEDVDFFVIDEFYKLSPQPNNGDDSRCDMLNIAFYKLYKKCKHFYMLGPNIDGLAKQVEGSISYIFIKEEFPTVGSIIHRAEGKPTADNIYKIYSYSKDSTLVYCNSPKKANALAIDLLEFKKDLKDTAVISALCEWIADTYHQDWSLISCLKHGIGLHHARLPRALAQLIIELFNHKILDILICTSTIIEGVNTSAKNVIMLEQKIGISNLDFFTFNNVAGRAGRMFKHFIGNVFIFSDPPKQILPFVDIPALSQSDDTSINILLGMDVEDLKEESYEKISEFYDEDNILSIETIKKSPHVKPEQQLSFARNILKKSQKWHPLLNWSSTPSYEQLTFVCDIMFRYFDAKNLASRSIKSPKQLAFYINRLRNNPTIKSIVNSDLHNAKSRNFDAPLDFFITSHLNFIRMWANYHFPRLLMTISNIQEELYKRLGISHGDYSYYALAVESLFFDPALICLEEYGIPLELSRKLQRQIAKNGNLDSTLKTLRSINIAELPLSRAEKMFLQRAVRYL